MRPEAQRFIAVMSAGDGPVVAVPEAALVDGGLQTMMVTADKTSHFAKPKIAAGRGTRPTGLSEGKGGSKPRICSGPALSTQSLNQHLSAAASSITSSSRQRLWPSTQLHGKWRSQARQIDAHDSCVLCMGRCAFCVHYSEFLTQTTPQPHTQHACGRLILHEQTVKRIEANTTLDSIVCDIAIVEMIEVERADDEDDGKIGVVAACCRQDEMLMIEHFCAEEPGRA